MQAALVCLSITHGHADLLRLFNCCLLNHIFPRVIRHQQPRWRGERGLIDRRLVTAHMPPPEEDCLIFVCGPPGMYGALCGPRDEEELSGVLADMGYSKEQVVKF